MSRGFFQLYSLDLSYVIKIKKKHSLSEQIIQTRQNKRKILGAQLFAQEKITRYFLYARTLGTLRSVLIEEISAVNK